MGDSLWGAGAAPINMNDHSSTASVDGVQCDICCEALSKHCHLADQQQIKHAAATSVVSSYVASLANDDVKESFVSVREAAELGITLTRSVVKHLHSDAHGVGRPLQIGRSLLRHAHRKQFHEAKAEVLSAGHASAPFRFARDIYDGSDDAARSSSDDSMSRYDMLRTARYAAAAFGPAYTEGFFSSSVTVATLSSSRSFHPYIKVPTSWHRTSLERLCASDGPDVEFVTAFSSIRPLEASFVVLLDHRKKWIVVSFRGTTSVGEMITDVHPAPVPLHLMYSDIHSPATGRDAHDHNGPEGFVCSVRDAVHRRKLMDLVLCLEEALPEFQTVVTGHSLGAAQANIFFLALELGGILWSEHRGAQSPQRKQQRQRRLVAFSAPPCVCSGTTAALMHHAPAVHQRMFNVSYGLDIFPRLQVASLRQLSQQQSSHGASTTTTNSSMPWYSIPGRLLWLSPETRDCHEIPNARPPSSVNDANHDDASRVCAMPLGWHRMVIHRSSVQDHFLANIYRHVWLNSTTSSSERSTR